MRVPTHIKEKLVEMAIEDSRGLSNYVSLALTEHVTNKVKINDRTKNTNK